METIGLLVDVINFKQNKAKQKVTRAALPFFSPRMERFALADSRGQILHALPFLSSGHHLLAFFCCLSSNVAYHHMQRLAISARHTGHIMFVSVRWRKADLVRGRSISQLSSLNPRPSLCPEAIDFAFQISFVALHLAFQNALKTLHFLFLTASAEALKT